jgi:hypothetical protein
LTGLAGTLSQLLEGDAGGLEELCTHEVTDDEESHDDEKTEELCAEFSAEFDKVEAALTKKIRKTVTCGQRR